MGLNKQPGQTLYARLGASYIQMHAIQGRILVSCYSSKGRRLWGAEIINVLWDGKGWDVEKLASMFKRWEREITTDKVERTDSYHE